MAREQTRLRYESEEGDEVFLSFDTASAMTHATPPQSIRFYTGQGRAWHFTLIGEDEDEVDDDD